MLVDALLRKITLAVPQLHVFNAGTLYIALGHLNNLHVSE